MTNDQFSKLATGAGWIMFGILGWSLDHQVASFEDKVDKLSDAQTAVIADVSGLKAHSQRNQELLKKLDASQSVKSEQLERLDALVSTLIQLNRQDQVRKR